MIFEYYPPETTNIQLSCQATIAYVHKQVQKDFTNYSKLLVQINNNSKITPDYIFFTIHGTAVVSPVQGYIIVYGVKDWSDSVDPRVYDSDFYKKMFEYKNDNMFMNTELDMNNHRIRNVSPPIHSNDVLNKGSIKITNIYLYGVVDSDHVLKNHNIPIGFNAVFLESIIIIIYTFI